MYTGPYKRPKGSQRDIIEGAMLEDLNVGDLVAVQCDHYDDLPQIAKVLGVTTDTIEVEWYGGSWTTVWKPVKRRDGRHLIPWAEIIPKSCVKLFDFSLTETGKLTKQRLKEAYKAEPADEN